MSREKAKSPWTCTIFYCHRQRLPSNFDVDCVLRLHGFGLSPQAPSDVIDKQANLCLHTAHVLDRKHSYLISMHDALTAREMFMTRRTFRSRGKSRRRLMPPLHGNRFRSRHDCHCGLGEIVQCKRLLSNCIIKQISGFFLSEVCQHLLDDVPVKPSEKFVDWRIFSKESLRKVYFRPAQLLHC